MGINNLVRDDEDSGSEGGFPVVDFSNVDFDPTDTEEQLLLQEKKIAFETTDQFHEDTLGSLGKLLSTGQYVQVLSSQDDLVALIKTFDVTPPATETTRNIRESIRGYVREREANDGSLEELIKLELVGIAALNLFLQCNYTGPALEPETVAPVYPLSMSTNAILAELAVDGYWPCPVCHYPFFLLLARCILLTLTTGVLNQEDDWTTSQSAGSMKIQTVRPKLSSILLWSARAGVAHQRLLQGSDSSVTLWDELNSIFDEAALRFPEIATLYLERGLAEHFFDRPGKGRKWFEIAREKSGLVMEVTGAVGKRTKFQSKATAQLVVKAQSVIETKSPDQSSTEAMKDQMVPHPEDGILLERVNFEEEAVNKIQSLSIVDQSILLAFCLDVKNNNPSDEALTNEEMGAYLARVLDHQDDWMVYSTALLERSWLEFSRSHARERSILQMQALADQHTNRLTITQSTRTSVEESALVQDRLSNVHRIVYPPRWSMMEDLADRYASIGIVTTAAELFTEIELWDSVVECYKRAGREGVAERIVRERLAIQETPRMWSALGDLTKDPAHYEKALELSCGRFSDAYLALGEHHFSKGDLVQACDNFEKALKVRPLIPSAWFRLGAMSMQLGQWQNSLRAFSEVVMQKPEEADAWANIAAVHMRNKKPAEAYPALNESLKYRRSNWRVWVSKLYTCLDLEKFDEAIQACNAILDLRKQKKASEGVPLLEAKCVKAIVGGALERLNSSQGNRAAQDSATRTLSRAQELLEKMRCDSELSEEIWILESIAHIQSATGTTSDRLDTLMTEYQSLVARPSWENDNDLVRKICSVVTDMAEIQLNNDRSTKQDLLKLRFMTRGVVKRVDTARPGDQFIPNEVVRLRRIQTEASEAILRVDS